MSHVRDVYFLMITLALGMVLWGVSYRWIPVTGGDNGISGIPRLETQIGLSGAGPVPFYYVALLVLVVCGASMALFVSSPFGYTLRGIRENESRMKSLGFNTWLHCYIAYVISGFFASVAGVVWAYYNGFVSPTYLDLAASSELFLMVTLGGPGTLVGPALGASAIVLLKNVISAYTQRWLLVLGIVYIVTIAGRAGRTLESRAAVRRIREPTVRPPAASRLTAPLLGTCRCHAADFACARLARHDTDHESQLTDTAKSPNVCPVGQSQQMGAPVKHKFFGIFLGAVALWAVSVPLSAHHGAASFDTTRELTLKGPVTEWIWANPHCFLKFDAKDETGTVRNWAVEVSNPTDMTARGWARTSFKAGDEVTVTLQPVKGGAPVGRLRSVILPNGQTLGTGAPPATACSRRRRQVVPDREEPHFVS